MTPEGKDASASTIPGMYFDTKDRLDTVSRFPNWKLQVRGILKSADAWSLIEPPAGWKKPTNYEPLNCAAVGLLYRSLDPSLLYLVEDKDQEASTMWEAICAHFAPTTSESKLRLAFKWMRMKPATNVDAHLKEYRDMLSTMAGLKMKPGNLWEVAGLLQTLPPEYDALVHDIAKEEECSPLEKVYTRIHDFSLTLEQRPAYGLAAKASSRSSSRAPSPSGRDSQPPAPCRKCGGNHWNADCTASPAAIEAHRRCKTPSGHAATANSATSCGTSPTANAAVSRLQLPDLDLSLDLPNTQRIGWAATTSMALAATGATNNWYLDSGASDHMTGLFHHLASPKPFSTAIQGINSSAQVTHVASVHITLDNGTSAVGATLRNVLYAPTLQINLLSVQQLGLRGLSVLFKPELATIFDKGSKTVYGKADRTPEGLYRLRLLPNAISPATPIALNGKAQRTSAVPLTLWHSRLCHANGADILRLARSGTITLSSTDREPCDPCLKSKSHRRTFTPRTEVASTRPLQLVHSDVLGIGAPSARGRLYICTFVDDYSRRTWVYPLRSKSEVHQSILHFQASAKRDCGHQLTTLRSDNGGKYLSGLTNKALSKMGVTHETTVPHTPQQNGVAERLNRTLLEGVCSILAASGLPVSMWEYALHAFVYTKN
ncbi:gag-pol polyprotein [Ceraceosorus bombacis]|uniref:Gag-pol polyprotein n=1 Tax=Ceraceosorus bombacis TaxID=401625 RepID=A0A0P1BPS1_9BASI|nr:gag-pol polyprotein [Ceraceosorus bombacis]